MADLEKVIKGMEMHASGICNALTSNGREYCPYWENNVNCMVALLKDALSLLKEQEPIAPKLIKMYPHDIYECGNCGHRSVGSKDYKAKFCPECGRMLKWDATE